MALNLDAQTERHRTLVELREVVDRGRRRPNLDERSAEQIIGYDADGLPRAAERGGTTSAG